MPHVFVVQLTADLDVIGSCLERRADHFMPAALLASQFAVREPLALTETGLSLDVTREPATLIGALLEHLMNSQK